MKKRSLLAIIPCFNEENNVLKVIQDLNNNSPQWDIVVVDDGSTDSTYEKASSKVKCLRLPVNLGIGGAVQTGIMFAFRRKYDACIQIDGDGQHSAKELSVILEKWQESEADMVIGSRYLDEQGFQSTFLRKLGSRVIGAWMMMLFGVRVSDPTSGMRLMGARTMSLFSENYPHDYPEPISTAYALKNGLIVNEVAVNMAARISGKSTIRFLATVGYMFRVLAYILLIKLRS